MHVKCKEKGKPLRNVSWHASLFPTSILEGILLRMLGQVQYRVATMYRHSMKSAIEKASGSVIELDLLSVVLRSRIFLIETQSKAEDKELAWRRLTLCQVVGGSRRF